MKSTDDKYHYFKPGELFYLLSHDLDQQTDSPMDGSEDNAQSDRYKNEPTFDEIINDLFRVSNEHADSFGLEVSRLELSRRKDNELHFSATVIPPNQSEQNAGLESEFASKLPQPQPQKAFSIIPAEVKPTNNDGVENNTEGFAKRTTNLILKLDGEMRIAKPHLGRGITLETVSLNWLATPASEHGGGGGPGGLPVPYRMIPKMAPSIVPGDVDVPFRFNIPNVKSLSPAGESSNGKGVVVAILDTAPCLHDVAEAYERYKKVDPQNQGERHPLIERLLKPHGPLHIHPASLDDLLRMRSVYLKDHDYQMTDHGLFVAGIINTIAPETEIHLYEVLNPYGVGDLLSIAKGLWKVLNRFSGQPLVVNCSLVLNIPRLNQPITDLDPNLVAQIIEDSDNNRNSAYLTSVSSDGEKWLARQGWAIEWICNKLLSEGSRVIAAAGNDWNEYESKDRPDPRFPAAFYSALGVGALKNNSLAPSSYSNISDEPASVGVATLGGEPGEKNGILGVYIGKFPPMKFWLKRFSPILRPIFGLLYAIRWGSFSGPKNTNDWAWWAGTSFATPIVTGVIASVLSDQSQPAKVEDVIRILYTNGSIEDSLLPSTGEDGIANVTQN